MRAHDLINDPPANILTRMTRETCSRCGRAVLTRPDGSQYGSAVDHPDCDEGGDMTEEDAMPARPGTQHGVYMYAVRKYGYDSPQAEVEWEEWVRLSGQTETDRAGATYRRVGDTRPLSEIYPTKEVS